MTLNLALASVKSTGSTTSRTFATRFSDEINVKDYGAVGNGTTDDTAAIQAAFDAAFGTRLSPNGITNRARNKPVFIPGGNYRITSPLYVTGVQGGIIYGNGIESTTFSFENPNTGNLWVPSGDGSEICPCIMYNGCSYLELSGITFGCNDLTNSVGVFVFTDGAITATSDVFRNLIFNGYSTGILGGYGGSGGNCDNCTLYNVLFFNCSLAGCRVVHQNAINWSVYGGGGHSCGFASTFVPGVTSGNGGALYSAVGGSISPICATSLSGNRWDFYTGSASPMTVIGGSSESPGCSVLNGTGAHFSGFSYRNTSSGSIVQTLGAITGGSGYVNGTYKNVPLTGGGGTGAQGYVTVSGGAVTFVGVSEPGTGYAIGNTLSASNANLGGSGSGFSVSVSSTSCIFIDVTFSGLVVADACLFSPGTNNGSGIICNMGNTGIAYFNELNAGGGAAACGFTGTSGSKLSVVADSLVNITAPYTNFTGQIQNIDIPIGTVSALTTAFPAAAKFKGIRTVVTDATVTTFMSTVAGTGGNTVPVVCDGTNWKIG